MRTLWEVEIFSSKTLDPVSFMDPTAEFGDVRLEFKHDRLEDEFADQQKDIETV